MAIYYFNPEECSFKMHNKVFTIKINETSLRIIFTKYLLCVLSIELIYSIYNIIFLPVLVLS